MQNEGNGPWKQRPGLYYWWESNRKGTGEAKSGEALVCGSWRPAPRAVWNSQGIQAVSTHPQPAEGAGPSSGFGCEVSANSHLPLSTGKTDVTHQPCGFSCACTSFKLSLCSDCAVCHSTVTLEMCATVAGEGWLPGKIWELCALLVYCKGKVKQVRFFPRQKLILLCGTRNWKLAHGQWLHQLRGISLLGVVAFLALYNMVTGISLVMSSYVFLCLTGRQWPFQNRDKQCDISGTTAILITNHSSSWGD